MAFCSIQKCTCIRSCVYLTWGNIKVTWIRNYRQQKRPDISLYPQGLERVIPASPKENLDFHKCQLDSHVLKHLYMQQKSSSMNNLTDYKELPLLTRSYLVIWLAFLIHWENKEVRSYLVCLIISFHHRLLWLIWKVSVEPKK